MDIDQDRLRDELRKMKQLIASDPKVLARFDTDGNGVIDGDEWAAVRQLVIQRLEREQGEHEEAKALAAEAGGWSEEPVVVRDPWALAGAGQGVAETIFGEDLQAAPPKAQNYRRIADADTIVLQQEKTFVGQLLGGLVASEYSIRDADGEVMGAIQQQGTDFGEEMSRGVFEAHRYVYLVTDALDGSTYTIERSPGLIAGERMSVSRNGHQPVADLSLVSLLSGKLEVRGHQDATSIYTKSPFFKPWSILIQDPFDVQIGDISRGWAGLGAFLSGKNRIRIRVNSKDVSANAKWGLIAAALTYDVKRERRR